MDDVSPSYLAKTRNSAINQDVSEMDAWAANLNNGGAPASNLFEALGKAGDGKSTLPMAKPARRNTDDVMGRQKPTTPLAAGGVMRNLAEIPGSALRGVHDAVMNATAFITPLTDWLDENVADLKYNLDDTIMHDPKTPTGGFVKETAKFLTGFIPAAKALKVVGAGEAAASIGGGAIADFATKAGNEARLSDWWKKSGMPQNVLTDYLASKPGDSEMEGRVKNAIEGLGLGALTEGAFRSVKALWAARQVDGAAKTEISYLKGKYGEVTDEQISKSGIGDPTKPVVQIGTPPAVAGEAPKLDPRALIRGTPRKAPEAPLAGHKSTELGDVIVNESAKEPGKFQVTFFDGPAKKGAIPTQDHVYASREEAIKAFDEAGAGTVHKQSWGDSWYHAGSYTSGEVRPGTFVNKDRSAVDAFAKNGGGKVSEFEIHPVNSASEADVVAEAKRLKIFDKDVPVGQYLEEGVYAESSGIIKSLREKGFDSVTVNDGLSKQPSLVVLDPKIAKQKAEPSMIRAEDFDVYVNFARFDEPDQIKFAIGKMAEASKGTIDEATRGKITQVETKKMADDLGMSVEELLSRRKGQGFNAEEAVAARRLWAASGEKLVELAKKASGAEASPMDHFAFRKMMATHAAIQAEVIGARTETARALASWAIPVKGGNVEKARLVDQILESTGGIKNSAEMAKRLSILAESGANPADIGRFAFKGYGAATSDAIKELWVNGLLSAPKTHIVNCTSNTITAFQAIYERQAAGLINSAVGGGADGVHIGEALSMAHGLISSFKDSWRLAAKYLRTGESEYRFGKVDVQTPNAISAEAFNMAKDTGAGRFVDFIGKVVGTPMHLLGAEDEFFRSIAYRMELHAQSLRTAAQEGHRGAELGKRMAELVNNPTEALRINSADAALYQTFTGQMGDFGKAVMNLRNIDHPLNPAVFVVPFIRTPVNIARYAFERTPFAPLVSQWRADIAAGGARADLALARMSTGTAIMLTAMDLADSGVITGSGPSGEDSATRESLSRQGWKPYSVNVGGRWWSYDKADPFGMTMGFAASIAETVKKGELDENDVDEWQEVTAMAIAAVSQVAISKTYLEGFSKFIEVMSDPKRHSERYVDDLFASFLPATSLNASVKNMIDPVQREANTPWEAVKARIALLSESLPPRRDLWGKEMTASSGFGNIYDQLTPVASKPIIDSPIDKEITRLEDGPKKIGKKTNFDGVQANMKHWPKAYDDYVRLAGNDLKHPAWGMGAKDYLDSVVSGNHPMSTVYNIMSDDSRRDFIKNTISDYRKLAQQQVLNDPKHSNFAQEIAYLKNHKFEMKLPVMGE